MSEKLKKRDQKSNQKKDIQQKESHSEGVSALDTLEIVNKGDLIVKTIKNKAFHMPALTNDIYVTRDKPMVVYKKRIEKLFYQDNYDTVVLYASGAAINTAVKLYL